ncbi:MAG TPA: hypothetical protein VG370_10995, partial [Chloroflexota bacterium]|nr:hypothetical protein [Chloroflexota bacterium]
MAVAAPAAIGMPAPTMPFQPERWEHDLDRHRVRAYPCPTDQLPLEREDAERHGVGTDGWRRHSED